MIGQPLSLLPPPGSIAVGGRRFQFAVVIFNNLRIARG